MKKFFIILITTILFGTTSCSKADSDGGQAGRYTNEIVGTWKSGDYPIYTFQSNGNYTSLYRDGRYTNNTSGTWMITKVQDEYILTTSTSDSGTNLSIMIVSIESGVFKGLSTKTMGQVTWYRQ